MDPVLDRAFLELTVDAARVRFHYPAVNEDIKRAIAAGDDAEITFLARKVRRLAAIPAEHSREPDAAAAPRTSPANGPKWDEATEARNKWVYEECIKLTPYKTIIAQLAKRTEWEPLTTISSVKRAANAYAKRHNLPPPPARHSGRPSKR